MNDEPIEYPVRNTASLSDDAALVYRRCRGVHLDRDVFDESKRNRYISPEEAKSFHPSDRMLAAIRELEGAGLAAYSDGPYGHSLHVTEVHEHYTVAFGRGSQLIKVSTFDRHPEKAELLAVMVGGDLVSHDGSTSRLSEIIVRSRHENATDIEHDASSTAQLTIQCVIPPVFSDYGRMEFQGVLTDARLYPLGADPLAQEDTDTRRSNELCTLCTDPHPFAPYLPPAASWLNGPTFVTVEALPLRPYLVAEPPWRLS